MTNSIRPRINLKLRTRALCVLASLLCSCAATSVKETWKAPDVHRPAGKIAVLAVDDRLLLRQGFENRLAGQLTKAGASARVTYNDLSLAEIKQDKRAAGDRFRSSGAETILIMRMVDATSTYRVVQPGGESYAAVITGIDSADWYGYYSVGFMNMATSYGNFKQRVALETSLYDLKTEKRLWSALTLTVVKETMDRVGEMDPLVAKIIEAMRKDGVIP